MQFQQYTRSLLSIITRIGWSNQAESTNLFRKALARSFQWSRSRDNMELTSPGRFRPITLKERRPAK